MALLPFPNNQTPPELAAAISGGPPAQTDPNDAVNGIITGFFNDARARLNAQDFGTVFSDMLKTVQSQPGPTPLPIPAPLHPIGQLASTFASALADLMGARYGINVGAGAAHEERVARNEQERKTAEQTNILRQDEFERRKASQELNIRMKINEARAEQAKQLGDLNEYEARLKAQGALRREQQKMTEDAKMKAIEATNKAILDRVLKETAARGTEARKTINYRMLLKTAVDTSKASDALKLWGKLQQQRIFSRDIAGEYINDPAAQEKMAEETYQEFLRRQAEEKSSAASDSTDFFDSFFNE
jgi:hypothetical protein